jgi:hypothetical protein
VRELPEIPIIECDAVCFQKSKVLFLERLRSMVLLLISDVFDHCIAAGPADRERSVPFLPVEAALTDYIVNPCRRAPLEISQHIGDAVGRFQSCEEMNVVGNASDFKSDAAEVA